MMSSAERVSCLLRSNKIRSEFKFDTCTTPKEVGLHIFAKVSASLSYSEKIKDFAKFKWQLICTLNREFIGEYQRHIKKMFYVFACCDSYTRNFNCKKEKSSLIEACNQPKFNGK